MQGTSWRLLLSFYTFSNKKGPYEPVSRGTLNEWLIQQKQSLTGARRQYVLKDYASVKGKYMWWNLYLVKLPPVNLQVFSITSVFLWILYIFSEWVFDRISQADFFFFSHSRKHIQAAKTRQDLWNYTVSSQYWSYFRGYWPNVFVINL